MAADALVGSRLKAAETLLPACTHNICPFLNKTRCHILITQLSGRDALPGEDDADWIQFPSLAAASRETGPGLAHLPLRYSRALSSRFPGFGGVRPEVAMACEPVGLWVLIFGLNSFASGGLLAFP